MVSCTILTHLSSSNRVMQSFASIKHQSFFIMLPLRALLRGELEHDRGRFGYLAVYCLALPPLSATILLQHISFAFTSHPTHCLRYHFRLPLDQLNPSTSQNFSVEISDYGFCEFVQMPSFNTTHACRSSNSPFAASPSRPLPLSPRRESSLLTWSS